MYGLDVEELNVAAQHPEDRQEKRAAVTELAALKTVENTSPKGEPESGTAAKVSLPPFCAFRRGSWR